ncbi:shufflon system plasmid conjugative transfer pilus tip adhesin PilV (plasmid) [Xanthomonas arboricola]|uniref:shufflon system plasmid conjugative transfer pilus tip adhesin PilV n=1 Tax=Xanthomonas arboricola TaxID=56448 RepID=UPI002B2C4435|nr:shufflon system plasmid conjugative transfer pilus tip adhesin PilV [Xanthomonas arboricola]
MIPYTLMHRAPPRRQAGFSLLEVTIALVVMIFLAGVAVRIMQDNNRREEAASTGDWLRVVATAAKTYEKANKAALQAAAGPSTTATATASQLASLLPPGFNTTGPQGHTFTVRWIEPVAGRLEGMVVLQGGDVLSGMSLLQVAGQAGGGAGYVDPLNPSQGKGPRGTWTVNLSTWGGSPGVGKPLYALFYDAEAETGTNDYLNRTAITGKPEVNRMSTTIDMAGNNLASAGTVTAGQVNASGGVQAASLAVGKAAFGAAPYPYETVQLAAGGNMRMAIGTREHTILQNDGSLVTHGNIGAEGNLAANNSVTGTEVYARNWFRTQGSGGWYSESYGGGWHMSDPTWIRAYGDKSIYTGGEVRAGSLNSMGSASIAGRATVGEYVQVNGKAAEGGGCSPNGLIGVDTAGPLFCTNGVWARPGGPTTGGYVYRGSGTGTMVGRNDSRYTSFLTVAVGGGGSNNYGAIVYVNGVLVGQITDFNRDYAKYDTGTFPIPTGGVWQVLPNNQNSSRTAISVYEYVQAQ